MLEPSQRLEELTRDLLERSRCLVSMQNEDGGDGSVGKVRAEQPRGPEFEPLVSM